MHNAFKLNNIDGVSFLSVPSFDETGLCVTCFSTRLGGVSRPPLDSMNLGFGRGDERETVLENYRILGGAAHFPHERLVAFTQVHKNDVFVAEEKDAGEAFVAQKREYDAVVTNVRNLPIATYHADCVPVLLLDPKRCAVGVAHAGWRGTALSCPAAAVRKMCEAFSSDPGDILVGIGPAIGECCFETDGDVPEAMLSSFGDDVSHFIKRGDNGKFRVSLSGINAFSLIKAGIPPKNITLSRECTCCKSELYWSHRKTHGVRGAMASIIMLK